MSLQGTDTWLYLTFLSREVRLNFAERRMMVSGLLSDNWGSRDGVVVRALASHQCGLGSIHGPGVICGLSLLLVLILAPKVFLWVLRFFSLHKNQHF